MDAGPRVLYIFFVVMSIVLACLKLWWLAALCLCAMGWHICKSACLMAVTTGSRLLRTARMLAQQGSSPAQAGRLVVARRFNGG
jgi:hypothetical protein